MNVSLEPGKYVLAVSGGVDSVVLLHLLQNLPGLELTVAHFDHGIRPDSVDDRAFVENMAKDYGRAFSYEEGRLGPNASEATARSARYKFLRSVQQQVGAQAIITAHHEDDVLETAILNLLRGTGRRGLSSLNETDDIKRPLIAIPKSQIVTYALQQNLSWHEDTSNHEERYARNYIRHRLLVRFDADARQQLLAIINRQRAVNNELDALLEVMLEPQGTVGTLNRRWFDSLSHESSKEVLAAWLRGQGIADYDRRTLERLSVGVKTARSGKRLDVSKGRCLQIRQHDLALKGLER